MRRLLLLLAAAWGLLGPWAVAWAGGQGHTARAPARIQDVRLWSGPATSRVVLDLTAPVRYRLFTLDHPPRVVLDLQGATMPQGLRRRPYRDGILRALRSARRGGSLRVVLDLKGAARPKAFLLPPSGDYGYRLVVDLDRPEAARRSPARAPVGAGRGEGREKAREVVVAVDAGHGGEDPGAKGYRGTYEKDVVLAIARRLARWVDREPGMRAVLVRDGDYYIPLRARMAKARRARADLFVSVHADAFRDPRARGSSVYVLSRRGASSEAARWLAASENASDLVGGVSLDDKDEVLRSVLLDLSQTATLEASLEAAQLVLRRLRGLGPVHRRQVEQASFVVLKSPDVPSMLVETGFISNPREERRLKDPAYQDRLAEAIFRGIRDFFLRNPPPGTLLAQRRPKAHVIARGETLSGIAARFGVSVERLRAANRLRGDLLRVGQVLLIPPGDG
ncbi:MAG: AMIN domain-containing protein [Gammaproteobacteria bacterium]|nr:MAG: AMIN domain-containing protein [Gammaproteobacteria bacterium]